MHLVAAIPAPSPDPRGLVNIQVALNGVFAHSTNEGEEALLLSTESDATFTCLTPCKMDGINGPRLSLIVGAVQY